jgi:hypothetical protein
VVESKERGYTTLSPHEEGQQGLREGVGTPNDGLDVSGFDLTSMRFKTVAAARS